MKKDRIVAASFGTTHENAIENAITPIESLFQDAYGDFQVERVFTSGMVIRSLKKKGIAVKNIRELLDSLENGIRVVIQPTHIIKGIEYDKLCEDAEKYREKFLSLKIGEPLLSRSEDIEAVCKCVLERFPEKNGQAVVLMGHGTEHCVNTVYALIEERFRLLGAGHILVATVEAKPSIHDIVRRLAEKDYKKVVLSPLMLVAGDHATNDMAGDEPDSWKSVLEAQGLEVETVMKGLGEYDAIRELYLKHLEAAVNASTGTLPSQPGRGGRVFNRMPPTLN